jgi:hypothetical protein
VHTLVVATLPAAIADTDKADDLPLRRVDADPAEWKVTQGLREREIRKVKKAKAEHSGEKAGPRRRIGFAPD